MKTRQELLKWLNLSKRNAIRNCNAQTDIALGKYWRGKANAYQDVIELVHRLSDRQKPAP